MASLPIGMSAYSRGHGVLAPIVLENLLVEEAPTSPSGKALLARPGLEEVYDRPNNRGVYSDPGVYGGALFYVSGESLYENDLLIGDLFGLDRIEWAYTVDGLFILSGGDVYLYNGVTLVQTAFPDDAAVASITQINNFVIAARQDTGVMYFRIPGDTTWNALDFFSAEREPDPVIAVRTLNDLLYAFGSSSVELFALTGDVDAPLDRVEGASFSRGTKDRDSIVPMDNTLIFIGEDSIAYRVGNVPERISDHGIDERLRRSGSATALSYNWDGHKVYVVQLDDETLAYDAAGGWSTMTRGEDPFPGIGHYDGSVNWVAGDKVWKLSERNDDDGLPLTRVFTSILPTEAPVFCDAIEIQMSPGVSAVGDEQAIVQTRWSDDQGRTWCDWRNGLTGFSGQYRKRLRIRRLGLADAPGRIFQHRITDPVYLRFSGVSLNPPLGGRSR